MPGLSIRSFITWEMRDSSGRIVAEGETTNVVTRVGVRMYSDRSLSLAGAPAAPTGMKLGTGSTSPAASGTGAALITYLTNSHQAFEAGYPSSLAQGDGRRISYRVIFPVGKATSATPVTEAVIVNDTLANATSTEANTISRMLLSGISAKPADQTLTITWSHDIGTG